MGLPWKPEALRAQLRLDKRDRPSRLRPRIARSGEGDARAKAGGARDNHFGEWDGASSRCSDRDLSASSVEVGTWHVCSQPEDRRARSTFDRSVPFLSMGNGNDPDGIISADAANQQACGKADRLARLTPVPHPGAHS